MPASERLNQLWILTRVCDFLNELSSHEELGVKCTGSLDAF